MTASARLFDDPPHAAAAAFVRRWAGGHSGWVVDAFAGAALQRAALRGERSDGAALALAAAGAEGRVVLVEEDPGLLARLEGELAAAGVAARRTADPSVAEPGETVLVEAPFAAVAASLARAVGDAPALVHLAPASARALPWPALEAAAAMPAADLLVRIPTDDFARVARFGGPIADLPPHLRRLLDGCSALLGDPRHGWIAAWRERARSDGETAAAETLAEIVGRRLAETSPGLLPRIVLPGGVPLIAMVRDPAVLELPLADEPAAADEDAPLDLFPAPPRPDAEGTPRLSDPATPRRPGTKKAGRRSRAAPPDLFDPPEG